VFVELHGVVITAIEMCFAIIWNPVVQTHVNIVGHDCFVVKTAKQASLECRICLFKCIALTMKEDFACFGSLFGETESQINEIVRLSSALCL
jgi:hypothetical protein